MIPAGHGLRLALALLALPGCAGINSQTQSYATLAEARQAGAIEKGWVPDGLPSGTYELRVGYDPGTDHRWGIINFPPGQSDTLRGLLQPEELPLAGQRSEVPGRIEWWPIQLRGTIDGEQLAATGVRGYRARQGGLIFAINWNQGRSYYWSAR